MRADEVARYLQDNPGFFNEHAEMLAHVCIPHPHGGRAISITERQILTLRERAKSLEAKLAELIRFGEENDAIGEKVHRLALALLSAPDLTAVLREIRGHLREDFAVPHVALRVWGGAVGHQGDAFAPVAEAERLLVADLPRARCGPVAGNPAAAWFGEDVQVRSMALVPIRRERQTIGALVLGSEETDRFYPEMGTLFLNRIGELVATALVRELG
ncbi:MAG: hypothetical protein AUK49_03900 [Betaproteobacteria bacterium CG2_30_68_42]|nr:MAG: hypothetical protein AUK49_03900 [Betaproteobacteria bacterium CG2_30_68_42]PJA56726.1 MAG: DUF484 domain-containing protein [Rhodocyclales bacterium CG_4_9_14_3_um_filter_68_10]